MTRPNKIVVQRVPHDDGWKFDIVWSNGKSIDCGYFLSKYAAEKSAKKLFQEITGMKPKYVSRHTGWLSSANSRWRYLVDTD